MSNIYYRERKLHSKNVSTQSHAKKPTFSIGKIFAPKSPQAPQPSITRENICAILDSTESGCGLHGQPSPPLPTMAWRSEEIYYDHKTAGKLFIPKNIHLTDGKDHYFIVMIDDRFELRYWPDFSSKKPFEERIDHVEAPAAAIPLIEQSFARLVDYLGVNKPYEERFAHVKSKQIDLGSLAKFASLLGAAAGLCETIAQNVQQAAAAPLAYFKENHDALETSGIDQPSDTLYQDVLVGALVKEHLVFVLDWKASKSDIEHVLTRHIQGGALSLPDQPKADTNAMLELAAVEFAKRQLHLVQIVTDSDAYALFVLSADKLESIMALAKKCKLELHIFGLN